uniref:hypothetical protein n=1 Tax=Ruegeria atlantica TaxID=81569 RepID=UPI001480B26A
MTGLQNRRKFGGRARPKLRGLVLPAVTVCGAILGLLLVEPVSDMFRTSVNPAGLQGPGQRHYTQTRIDTGRGER